MRLLALSALCWLALAATLVPVAHAQDDGDDEAYTMPPDEDKTAPPAPETTADPESAAGALIAALEEEEEEMEENDGAEPDPNSELMQTINELEHDPSVDPETIADAEAEMKESLKANSRKKRFVENKKKYIWDGAVVPYDFSKISKGEQKKIRWVFDLYESLTCFRFKERKAGQSNADLGVAHGGYLIFVNRGDGCWSGLGNVRTGMEISCCGGYTCVHELGHALGAFHEQSDPDSRASVRINMHNVQESKRHNFIRKLKGQGYSSGYDSQSVMHYSMHAFSKKGKNSLNLLDSSLNLGGDIYYLFKDLSHTHSCAAQCPDFSLTCVNDGYVDVVNGECACMCPKGLDPSNGCASILGKDDSNKWAKASYSLPAPASGCAGSFKQETQVIKAGKPKKCKNKAPKPACNLWAGKMNGCVTNPHFVHKQCAKDCKLCDKMGSFMSEGNELASTVEKDLRSINHVMCTNDGSIGEDVPLPKGSYCVFKSGGSCPEGFESGKTTFQDKKSLEYCCQSAPATGPMNFPSSESFSLLHYNTKGCPSVAGMNAYYQFMIINNGKKVKETGASLLLSSKEKNVYLLPYCVYRPTKRCGEVIELSADKPQVTIEGTSDVDQECKWLVKGTNDEYTHLTVSFDEFDLGKQNVPGAPSMEDYVKLHYNRLGSSGTPTLKGKGTERTWTSIYQTIIMDYKTFGSGKSSFKATFKLITPESLCYNAADHGLTYAGDVSITRSFKQCIPWAQAAHCPHSPYKMGDFHDNLQGNKCRNPSAKDGQQPWCYTSAEECFRDYCDVCMIENLYDSSNNCPGLAALGLCDHDPLAFQKCAKSCPPKLPEHPADAKSVTCGAPSGVSDGEMVEAAQSSYNVGDKVTYRCSADPDTTWDRRCLTTGQWSSLNYVCTDCQDGWFEHNGNCYKHFPEKVTYPGAEEACQAVAAEVTMVKSQEENDHILSFIKDQYTSWLAGSDNAAEGTFVWRDGSAFDYTNWARGEPDNWANMQDCVAMNRMGIWDDESCTRDKHSYTCVKPVKATPKVSCDAVVDFTDTCADVYANDPQSCETQPDFMKQKCRKTCGVCNGDAGSCPVEAAGDGVVLKSGGGSVAVGGFAEHGCKDGCSVVSGDAVRGCAGGAMTGAPLVCNCVKEWKSESTELKKGWPWGGDKKAKTAYTGLPYLKIDKNGKIVRWEFYSNAVGEGSFQVWRGKGKKMKLIGENALTTTNVGEQTYWVPEGEQISVKKGDFIGIYYKDNHFIGYTACKAKKKRNKKLKKKLLSAKKVGKVGKSSSFKKEKKWCREYKLRAVVA